MMSTIVTIIVIIVVDDAHPRVHAIDEVPAHVADDEVFAWSGEGECIRAIVRER
jgi:hypothetical protein